jgi:hypothetical protein
MLNFLDGCLKHKHISVLLEFIQNQNKTIEITSRMLCSEYIIVLVSFILSGQFVRENMVSCLNFE